MSDRKCAMSNCEAKPARLTHPLSQHFLARHPLAFRICAEHYELVATEPLPPARERAAHPAYKMFGHPVPVCYGLGGRCEVDGDLYPSGVWCEEHKP